MEVNCEREMCLSCLVAPDYCLIIWFWWFGNLVPTGVGLILLLLFMEPIPCILWGTQGWAGPVSSEGLRAVLSPCAAAGAQQGPELPVSVSTALPCQGALTPPALLLKHLELLFISQRLCSLIFCFFPKHILVFSVHALEQ